MPAQPHPADILRRRLVPVLCLLHVLFHLAGAAAGRYELWQPFLIILLAANLAIGWWLYTGSGDALTGTGVVLLVAAHGLIGHHLAPTAVASAAMLLGNLLTMYVGIKLFQHCSRLHLVLFTLSYLALFFIFVKALDHAEPLFLLALLGLAATAKDFKLLSYFWVLVLSFTLAQPFAWQTALLSFFILKMLFTAKAEVSARITMVFLALGLVLLFLVLFPVAVMVMGESAYNLINVFKDKDILAAVGITLLTATIATLFLALLSIPLAYALARLHFWGKSLLLSVIDIPIIIPQSVAGIALLKVLGKQQIVGGMLFDAFGIRFDGTLLGIVAAQIFVALPFFVKSAMAAFENVPLHYELAARTLGAGSFSAFWRIALPLAARGVFLGAVIAWARAAGEFGAVFFIAAFPETAPIAVYTRFMSLGLAETAPIVSALLLFSLFMFFLLQLSVRLLPSWHPEEGKR
ncbi:ABC transporter permease [candidate division FCPU426 bacterium]|nr:ABC transporter permease [candidate division FCPU426 bacterium]